jgi:hypothetical protein
VKGSWKKNAKKDRRRDSYLGFSQHAIKDRHPRHPSKQDMKKILMDEQ